jgi:4-amino-4-deoxy-L-arabinose transferase-like glycosyltransferase
VGNDDVVREDARRPGFKPALLLGVWAAVIFVFFSLSGSKLPGYIVPVFPALAILAAVGARSARPRRSGDGTCSWPASLVVAGLFALPLLSRQGADPVMREAFHAYAGSLASPARPDPVRPGDRALGGPQAVSDGASRSTP